MRNVPKLLDRARELCSPPTDYRLAKTLGVSPQRLSNWRRQDAAPDNEAAWKLAKLLGMPIPEVIAYIEEDKAKTEKAREFWTLQLPRALPPIAIAVTTLLAIGGTLIGGFGGVAMATAYNIGTGHVIYYAKYGRHAETTGTARSEQARDHSASAPPATGIPSPRHAPGPRRPESGS